MFEKVLEIRDAKSKSLAALARRVGGNPATFYRGADFSDTDLRGQDLSGFDLSGVRWKGVLIDLRTKIDAPFAVNARLAAIERLNVELETRRDPKRIWNLALLYSIEPNLFDLEQTLEDLIEHYDFAPANLIDLSGRVAHDRFQVPLLERFIRSHHAGRDFDLAYAALLLDPYWKNAALRVATREMYLTQRGQVPADVARAVATAAEQDASMVATLQRWANERGNQERAATVISRAIVTLHHRPWIDQWVERWLKRHQRTAAMAHALVCLATISARTKHWPVDLRLTHSSLSDNLISALVQVADLAASRSPTLPLSIASDLQSATSALRAVLKDLPEPNHEEEEIRDMIERFDYLAKAAQSNLPKLPKERSITNPDRIIGDVLPYVLDDWIE